MPDSALLGFNQTVIHPLGLTVFILMAIGMVALKRVSALLPLLILMAFISTQQRIEILGADFTLLRLLIMVGFFRVLYRGELRWIKLNTFDRFVLSWFGVTAVATVLLSGSFGSIIYMIGRSIEILGSYFLFRAMIRSEEDALQLMGYAVAIALGTVGFFVYELQTGTNLFSIFGGVPELTMERDGSLRAQGAFPHPILAGCFWAALVPFAWVLFKTGSMKIGLLGIVAMVTMVMGTHSSTPLLGLVAGVFGLFFYNYRHYMGLAVKTMFAMMPVLMLIMQAPIWWIFSKLNVIGSSTGWYRSYLIDTAVSRFPEWALIGTPSTAHWGWGLWDITNGFVAAAVHGGLVGLVLFNLMAWGALVFTFDAVKASSNNRNRIIIWGVLVSLLVDVTDLQAVNFLGQVEVIWFAKMAIAGSLLQLLLAQQERVQPVAARASIGVVGLRTRVRP